MVLRGPAILRSAAAECVGTEVNNHLCKTVLGTTLILPQHKLSVPPNQFPHAVRTHGGHLYESQNGLAGKGPSMII